MLPWVLQQRPCIGWRPTMDVAEIMTRTVVSTGPSTTIGEALRLLEDQQIRHLPVVDDGQLLGMVSDRDLREYRLPLMQEVADPQYAGRLLDGPVSEAMATLLISVEGSEDVRVAIDLMVEYGVGAVPVVDRHNDELVGILSYIDVLRALRAAL